MTVTQKHGMIMFSPSHTHTHTRTQASASLCRVASFSFTEDFLHMVGKW